MMSFLRWLGRALFALLILALLAGIWVSWTFQQWKTQKLATLDAGSTIVETAAGSIEYTEFGTGPAVLICHGAPGGYDQAALIGASLAKDGFRVIAPSRPGFLRTPLTSGLLFDDQADAMVALLDKLGIKQASVIGFSTGAQVAVSLALRHPDRISALVLLSPVTTPFQPSAADGTRQILTNAALFQTTGDMGAWLFAKQARRDPRWMLEGVFSRDTTLDESARGKLVDFVIKDADQLAFFQNLVGTQAPLSPRESGTRNDLLLVRALPPIAYEKILPPILIVHGSADAAEKWDDPKIITDKLPSAKVVSVENAGALVWFGPKAAEAERAVRNFLKNPSPPAVPPTPTPTPVPSTN